MRNRSRWLMAALLFCPAVGGAQSLLVGGRAGATTARLEPDYSIGNSLRGVSVGATVVMEKGAWLAAEVELSHVMKGTRESRAFELRTDYLELPLTVRLSAPFATGGMRLFAVAGVAPGVELHCTGYEPVALPSGSPPPGTAALNCDGWRKRRNDVGRVIGAGLLYDLERHQLSLDVRRIRGLNVAQAGRNAYHNEVTAFSLGIARRVRGRQPAAD